MRSIKRIKPFLKYIEDKWMQNPDLRFGQLLINLKLIEDSFNTWNAEISDYPLPHDIMREIQTWGTFGNIGGEFAEKYIKDLDTDHIKAILKTQEHIKGTGIENILKTELKFRMKKKVKKKSKHAKK